MKKQQYITYTKVIDCSELHQKIKQKIMRPNGTVYREELKSLIANTYKICNETQCYIIGELIKYGYLDITDTTSPRYCFYKVC